MVQFPWFEFHFYFATYTVSANRYWDAGMDVPVIYKAINNH